MNDTKHIKADFAGTAAVILSAFLLFYLPSMLAIFSHGDEPWEWTVLSIIMATLYTAIFCINYFWIVPDTLVKKDRKSLFFLYNIVLILLACAIVPIWFEALGGPPGPRHHAKPLSVGGYLLGYVRFMLRDCIMMVLAAALAYALRLSREQEKMRRRELELDAETRRIELKSLKAQLNPHFLFNSLNNIYALIAISPERAQTALHDLSGMLRYMIYDAASSYVPLEKELLFIQDYVRLMKLRLSSSVEISCHADIPNAAKLRIVPLLFLTIVENAFKHLSPAAAGRFIAIDITSEGPWVECRVRNSCSNSESSEPVAASGVGLDNVKRQLNLLYPDAHSFSASETDNIFTAIIKIRTE